jgi:hypothetical protein
MRQLRGDLPPHLTTMGDRTLSHVSFPCRQVPILFRPRQEAREHLVVTVEAVLLFLPNIGKTLQLPLRPPLGQTLRQLTEPLWQLPAVEPGNEPIARGVE